MIIVMGPIQSSYQAIGVHIRCLQLILGLRWWNKVTHSKIRSRAITPSMKSMLLHRQLRWLGHAIIMPDIRLPHRVLYGQLRQDHRSVCDKQNTSRTTSSRSFKCATFHLTGWGPLHSTELPDDQPVPMECRILTLNMIALQFSDTSMPQHPASFKILLTSVHLVADNTPHTLASTAAVKLTFNDEEENVVIHNGWTAEEKDILFQNIHHTFIQ